ncbi:MAG: signal peptidase I [Clostridia bacterium]|nr:signal peptidase I [Clostridia bacterium]
MTANKQKKGKRLTGIIRIVLIVICGAVLGVNVYLANAARLVGNDLPTPFGYGMAVVLSGSMEPALSVDDMIIVKKTEDISLRDIVVYSDGRSLVVHRVVKLEGDTVTTMGDANGIEDAPISRSLIKGRVVLTVPYIGKLINVIKSPLGTALIIAAAILLVELPRILEKKKDEKEKQAIIDEIKKLRDEIK